VQLGVPKAAQEGTLAMADHCGLTARKACTPFLKTWEEDPLQGESLRNLSRVCGKVEGVSSKGQNFGQNFRLSGLVRELWNGVGKLAPKPKEVGEIGQADTSLVAAL
jgi:hypothetical protein